MAHRTEDMSDWFDFDSWAVEYKLTKKTICRLREEDLNTVNVLRELEPEDIKELNLNLGERKLLLLAVDSLRNGTKDNIEDTQRDLTASEEVSFDAMPRPVPWNGCHAGIEMINTCAVDNMLYFFHVLQLQRDDMRTDFAKSEEQALRLLYEVHTCFKDSRFSEGKYLWLKQFFSVDSNLKEWDAFGHESKYSFSKLQTILKSSFNSTCSETGSCSQPEKILHSTIIESRSQEHGSKDFANGVETWVMNNPQTKCGYKEKNSERQCVGVRKETPRKFNSEEPPFLLIDLASCDWKILPLSMNVLNTEYSLKMITYGNSTHFVASMRFHAQWWLYDGYKEYKKKATGLQKQKEPLPPDGYIRSFCVYTKLPSGDLRRSMEGHGIDVDYWQAIFHEQLEISAMKQLSHLTQKEFKTLASCSRSAFELISLKTMIKEAGGIIFHNNSNVNIEGILKELNMEEFHPGKISLPQVMSVMTEPTKGLAQSTFCPLVYLHNLIMLGYKTRDAHLPKPHSEQSETSKQTTGIKSVLSTCKSGVSDFHPQDVFLMVFQCCNLHLRQVLMKKCFLCRLAIPFISPMNGNLECAIWSLRSIVAYYKNAEKINVQNVIVNASLHIIGFCRIKSNKNHSKSKLLNELLSDSAHPTFYHRDCPQGMTKRLVSNGMIEASWYLPSGTDSDLFKTCTMFLNLRGDCLEHKRQAGIMRKIVAVTVLFVNVEELGDQTICQNINYFAKKTQVILVIGSQLKMCKQKLEHILTQCSNHLGEENVSRLYFIYTSTVNMGKDATQINSEIRASISACLTRNNVNTLEACLNVFREKCCDIDEDIKSSIEGKIHADDMLQNLSKNTLSKKSLMLPLQDLWLQWSKLQQKQSRAVGKGTLTTAMEETEDLRNEMGKIRKEQGRLCTISSPLVKRFIKILTNAFRSDAFSEMTPFFLCWVKLCLDGRSRENLQEMQRAYEEKLRDLQKVKNKRDFTVTGEKEAMQLAEKQLVGASFGLEHLFRELGQMYEAVAEHKTNVQDIMRKQLNEMPIIVAHILIGGQPFELMDGDAGNIPIKWMKAIFTSLEHILGQSKIFVVSVLGIQSSGKSTLLNTMFGLEFSVSAGRCTRGVYMQMLKVGKEYSDLPFDYVLVIDSEGLRAPELGKQKYDHDNEIATLVIGISDVTIINVKGESYAEMKDIIQVAVHAFLRMKLVSFSHTNRRRCIFVHQNVPATNAEEAMRHGSQKLQDGLDEMAQEAASQENILGINSFSNIIEFNCLSDVWFLPDLWHGNPPMAHVNIGYSEKVKNIKRQVLFQFSKSQKSFLSLEDIYQNIEELWKGILSDDFVFSFRNVIELKAYSHLESTIIDITWTLEEELDDWLNTKAEPLMGSCRNNEDAKKCGLDLKSEIDSFIQNKADLNKEKLSIYFLNSSYADIIEKWHEQKKNVLQSHSCDMLLKMKEELMELQTRHELRLLTNENHMIHKDDIMSKALDVALELKGTALSEDALREKFDHVWLSWQACTSENKINIISPGNILRQMSGLLFSLFPQHHQIVKYHLNINPIGVKANFSPLENSIGIIDIRQEDGYLSIEVADSIDTFSAQREVLESGHQVAMNIINEALKNADIFLKDLCKTDTKFSKVHVKKLISMIQKCPTQNIGEGEKYKMTLLPRLLIKVSVLVCQYAYPMLCEMQQAYEENNSFFPMIKRSTWKLFKNTVLSQEEELVADLICDCLQERIRTALNERIHRKIYRLQSRHFKTKARLMYKVLHSFAIKDSFGTFDGYIRSPKESVLLWLTDYINKYYFTRQDSKPSKYADLAIANLNEIMQKVLENMSEAVKECRSNHADHDSFIDVGKLIDAFCNLAKYNISISRSHLQHLARRNIADLSSFLGIFKTKLQAERTLLAESFTSVTCDTIKWGKKAVNMAVLEKLWGCEAICPFCNEPCLYSDPKHIADDMPHTCIQHRPGGASGWHWKSDQKLLNTACNYNVKQNARFVCTKATCITSKTCAAQSPNMPVYHPYREYKTHLPDWSISPDEDMESSKYWLWFMARYQIKLAKKYHLKPAHIPPSWKNITKDEAIKSLEGFYL